MIEQIKSGDHRLMKRLNRWRAPRWIRLWMICATRGGDGWLWYAVAIAIAMFGGQARVAALGAAGLAVGLGIALFISIKRTTRRRRPCALEPHAWSKLLPPDQFSFPSGHTITAFAMSLAVGSFYPGVMPVLLFCAVSIGLSRILLGMHFLSDVLAGAGIGSLLGYGASLVVH
ncbi:MAG: phosphatase PAP2 family protein [Bryobacteraceae bacterium]